jgi:hypothetical protein
MGKENRKNREEDTAGWVYANRAYNFAHYRRIGWRPYRFSSRTDNRDTYFYWGYIEKTKLSILFAI